MTKLSFCDDEPASRMSPVSCNIPETAVKESSETSLEKPPEKHTVVNPSPLSLYQACFDGPIEKEEDWILRVKFIKLSLKNQISDFAPFLTVKLAGQSHSHQIIVGDNRPNNFDSSFMDFKFTMQSIEGLSLEIYLKSSQREVIAECNFILGQCSVSLLKTLETNDVESIPKSLQYFSSAEIKAFDLLLDGVSIGKVYLQIGLLEKNQFITDHGSISWEELEEYSDNELEDDFIRVERANKSHLIDSILKADDSERFMSVIRLSNDEIIQKVPSKSIETKMSGYKSTDLIGVFDLKVVGAKHLPGRNYFFKTRKNLRPFVIISFSKESYKTKIRRNVNPLFNERLVIPLKAPESSYSIVFSVYTYDRFTYNRLIGTTKIAAKTFFDKPEIIHKFALKIEAPNLQQTGSHEAPLLFIQGSFIPFTRVINNFWRVLSSSYDSDDSGLLNKVEVLTLLNSIGASISEYCMNEMFQSNTAINSSPEEESDEIPIQEFVQKMSEKSFIASLKSSSGVSLSSNESQEDASFNSISPLNNGEQNDCNLIILELQKCPMCATKWSEKKHDNDDIIAHLAVCTIRDSSKVDRLMMGGFLTEEYASRKWFFRFMSYLSFGGYNIGKNNGNIIVQERATGKLIEEKIPTYIRLGIRLLSSNAYTKARESRRIKQLMASLTLKRGAKFDSPSSVKAIREFVRYHNINLSEIKDPLSSFRNFNEFFYRKLKSDARILANPDMHVAVSPADCRIHCFENVSDATRFWIKGSNFSIASLLKDVNLGEYYSDGGSMVICRLAPQDYHRFHAPVDGFLSISYDILGAYYTVNPMAVRSKTDVLTENVRKISFINSEIFGKVAFVSIGAMMVGSIYLTATEGSFLHRMDEIGYFAFGGSTIIVLYPPNSIVLDSDLVKNSKQQIETLVKVGDSIGHSIYRRKNTGI